MSDQLHAPTHLPPVPIW